MPENARTASTNLACIRGGFTATSQGVRRMYRIEVKPGEENVFRTIEELATAIRNGLVTPKSRIFHNASQKWLPIEFHPPYKKALQLPKTNSGEQPAVAVSSPTPKPQQSPKIPEPPKPQDSARS